MVDKYLIICPRTYCEIRKVVIKFKTWGLLKKIMGNLSFINKKMIFYMLKVTGKNQEIVIAASNILSEFAKEGNDDVTIEIIICQRQEKNLT